MRFLSLLSLLSVAACDAVSPAVADSASAARAAGSPGACLHVEAAGLFDLGFPVLLPSPVDLAGAGGLPAPVDFGPFQGTLSSVVTDFGDGPANGAQNWTLVHYFVDGDGDAFWTEDRAVCAPAGPDPSTCRLNNNMTVVGGTGRFAGASGRLHNHGEITITDPTFATSPYGSLQGVLRGRVCAGGL